MRRLLPFAFSLACLPVLASQPGQALDGSAREIARTAPKAAAIGGFRRTSFGTHPRRDIEGTKDGTAGEAPSDGADVLQACPGDADCDGIADGTDDCPTVPNPSQTDADGDGVGDACDNCPSVFNESQSDFDHDGEGDTCDLDDGLIYILGPSDKNLIEWQTEIGPTQWNVYTGDLDVLKESGVYTQAPWSNALASQSCGSTDAFVANAVTPLPGKVQFSLVTGVESGVETDLGGDSDGKPRPNSTVVISPPADNSNVSGVVTTTASVPGDDAYTYTGVTITYVHAIVGLTRTFESDQWGRSWTDSGWIADPPGDYTITATVRRWGDSCVRSTRIRVHAGAVVGCCVDMYPSSNTTLSCATGATGCKQVSFELANDRCLTGVALSAMTVSWIDYSGNRPNWQTARFNGVDIAPPGPPSWTLTYDGTIDPVGTATKSDFGPSGPQLPSVIPPTAGNATTVTYVFDKPTDSGPRTNRTVDVFPTNQYTFLLLDAFGNPTGLMTICSFRNLTVN